MQPCSEFVSQYCFHLKITLAFSSQSVSALCASELKKKKNSNNFSYSETQCGAIDQIFLFYVILQLTLA